MKEIDKNSTNSSRKWGDLNGKLGSKVNLSPSPCYRRVKNLKDADFIDKSVAVNKQN